MLDINRYYNQQKGKQLFNLTEMRIDAVKPVQYSTSVKYKMKRKWYNRLSTTHK